MLTAACGLRLCASCESAVPTPDGPDVVDEIASSVRLYVRTHPDAADSGDGIHRWWLVPGLRDETREHVAAALERLVEEGVLRRVTLEDGQVIYSGVRSQPQGGRD